MMAYIVVGYARGHDHLEDLAVPVPVPRSRTTKPMAVDVEMNETPDEQGCCG